MLIIASSMLVSASAFAQTLAERNYPPKDTTITLESSNLPLIWVTTTDTLSRYTRSLGRMKIINNGDGVNYSDTISHPDQTVEFDGPISIKWRGASSFGYDGTQSKKPMSVKTLKTENINGKKDKVRLLGMGKDSDWCFLAPWQDRSYIRDILSMQMADEGYAFVPQMKYCEVFVDGIYYGLFILSERATKGSNRLDLWDYGLDADGNPLNDTTGDFHVEVDRPENNFSHEQEPHYTSKYHPVYTDGSEITDRFITYQYKDPEEEDFENLPGAREALHKSIDDMEGAFYDNNYKDLYGEYIDTESFMDYEIAQELANNIDGYRLSTPMYKYSVTHALSTGDNSKWKMALWDFNIAYGMFPNDHMQPNRDAWRCFANDILYDDVLQKEELNPFYWQRLMDDDSYVEGIKARYTQRRLGSYNNDRIDAICDSLKQILEQGAVTRDNQAWKRSLNLTNNIASVRQFISNRLAWMDEQWYDPNLLDDIELTGSTFWKDDSWNTLCLPFRLSSIEGTPLEGAAIKTLVSSNFSNGILTLNFTEKDITSIEAGKPYIVKWEDGDNIPNPEFKNMILKDVPPETIETDYIDMVGTFQPLTLQEEDRTALYLGASNMLYYPLSEVSIGANHAYFRLKNGLMAGDSSQGTSIHSIILNFEEETNAIQTLIRENQSQYKDDNWYTLDGIRLNGRPIQKGIYIRHGHKVSIE